MRKEFRLTQVFTMGRTKTSETPAPSAPSTTSTTRPRPCLRSAKQASDVAPGNVPDNTKAAPVNDGAKQHSNKRGAVDREDNLPEAKKV
jgi:hypothetical protein